jgi:hypothetical protein
MKYIKRFDEKNEKSIEDWCGELGLIDFNVDNDGLVDVNNDFQINRNKLKKIPIKFNYIKGSFWWTGGHLTSLKGSPKIVEGGFYCRYNNIKTLIGGPEKVGKGFDCNTNLLTSLEGGPNSVGEYYICSHNDLESLEGSPAILKYGFYCQCNNLKTLKNGPTISEHYNCSHNKLKTLEGLPEKTGILYCDGNPVYEVFAVFGTFERYKASLDYNYWRGTDIVRGRFNRACEDAGIKMPRTFEGYEYIDL